MVAFVALMTSLLLVGVQSLIGMALVAALITSSNAAARVALPARPATWNPLPDESGRRRPAACSSTRDPAVAGRTASG